MTNEAFKKIVNQYEKLVFTICYQLVKDYHEAQNLAQDTFVSAYSHIDNCNLTDLKPWLGRIAANKSKDFLKSAYRRKVELTGEFSENICSKFAESPEDILMEFEKEENLYETIRSLKEPYLKAATLFFIEEKTMDEIAVILNRPKKTVQTQLSRAKLLLQEKIGREDK